MAERSQPQYTALVGPVWLDPVASRLAWLPSAQQPARSLPRAQFDYSVFVQLVVAAPAFDPKTLEWVPSGRTPTFIELRRVGDVQQPPFAALYDPQRVEWMPSDRYFGRTLQSAPLDLSVYTVLVIPPAAADVVPLYIRIDGLHLPTYGLRI